MQIATLEHVNITVSDPKATATMLCGIFGWHIRWEGPSMDNGYTVHVGTKDCYIALYATETSSPSGIESYKMVNGLNHIALTVDDLDMIEKRVLAAGFKTLNHSEYEPGRRFYFRDSDNIEYEIVSYLSNKGMLKREITQKMGRIAKYGSLMR